MQSDDQVLSIVAVKFAQRWTQSHPVAEPEQPDDVRLRHLIDARLRHLIGLALNSAPR